MGFTRGYSIGEEAGWKDGYSFGIKKGAQIASEVGFYQGFIHAWLTILEKDESSKQKKLLALKTLLELIQSFHSNVQEDDFAKKLETIRVKFKQIKSLLNSNLIAYSLDENINCSSFSSTSSSAFPRKQYSSDGQVKSHEMSF